MKNKYYVFVWGAFEFQCRIWERTVDAVKRTDLENYQEQRLESGVAPATVDKEVSIAKTMVTKAFDDDKIGGDVLKPSGPSRKSSKKVPTQGHGLLPLTNTQDSFQKRRLT